MLSPSFVEPAKNSTLETTPVVVSALAAMGMVAGAVYWVPKAGLVIVLDAPGVPLSVNTQSPGMETVKVPLLTAAEPAYARFVVADV